MPPDIEHLKWAIEQRAEVQHTLLALYSFTSRRQGDHLDTFERRLLDSLIGAAFSLWRAVFLAETSREIVEIHESQVAFLEKVVSDNAITYTDDKNNRAWSVEYYLENAKFRLTQAVFQLDHVNKSNELTKNLNPFLRLRGTLGAELTRYEWEAAHYVLRHLLRVLDPTTKLAANPPSAPKPKGISAIFVDENEPPPEGRRGS